MNMREIVDRLNDYAYRYYTLDDPAVSDAEYDSLYDSLLKLERETGIVLEDSPTIRVGGKILDGFEKHRHIVPLWSLDKSQSQSGLLDWMKRTDKLALSAGLPKPEYSLEYKFDGLTINLTYENGFLMCGATRGDGETGEDVTAAIKTIKSIPLSIPFKGRMEVQGEAIMELSVLEQYNKSSDEPLKNARNAAAGAIRNLDVNETAKRKLNAFIYNVGYIEGKTFENHSEMIGFLRDNKFRVSEYEYIFTDIEGIMNAVREVEEKTRDSLDFLIDGMVVKITDMKTREILGYTQKFPRWAIAYKFPAVEKTTYIENITWEVGRTGKLTPVAHVRDVDICGVTVKKATLNNFDDILRKNVAIGSRVFIRRSNDVIPEILGATSLQDQQLIPVIKPEFCPACGSRLVQIGPNLFCENSLDCRPQLVSRLTHFVSRDAMNVDGLSIKTLEVLFDKLSISDISEIYTLKAEDFVGIDGFADKKTLNLMESIEKSKNPDLDNFIFALGIPNVGKKTAKDLAAFYCTFDAFLDANESELLSIKDIGEIVAHSIITFLSNPHYKAIIKRLLDYGVSPRDFDKADGVKPFENLTFVLTGTLSGYKRSEAQKIIENFGGSVSSSVSQKTDYVLCGENAGSKKSKAEQLGVKLLSESDFNDMINKYV